MMEALAEIHKRWLAEGNSVNTRLAHFHASIPGSYDEGEYPKEAVIRITASKEVAELAKKIPLRRVEPVNQMHIELIHDVKSNTVNSTITSGGSVKIRGHNLKISGENPAVGVEFVNADNTAVVYPVTGQDIVVNNPSDLIIIAPAMSPGEEVLLRITTQFSGSKDLKAPRSTTFEKRLTVA
ncbi:MAG: DUF4469 domain-containing protein [Prevotellaceae bacterium]|jgi:hypothetical protein|nr:DUF4469 domain-containing protein [Prevotellaceae bacterium]